MSEPSQQPAPNPPGQSKDSITLRQYYAGQALVGWITMYAGGARGALPSYPDIAEDCYEMADAMLAQEAKTK